MMKQLAVVIPALVAAGVWGGRATAAEEKLMGPGNVKWVSCGVPEFPGCEAALLQGDPGKGPYSMYVRLPAGAAFQPHWHSNPHYLVGIEGTLTFATRMAPKCLSARGRLPIGPATS
jgi:hypothetical protein